MNKYEEPSLVVISLNLDVITTSETTGFDTPGAGTGNSEGMGGIW